MYSLVFKWSISRGRATYGYNICSLWVDGIKVSSCNGGGYDMKGTAFADYIQDAYQDELLVMADRSGATYIVSEVDGEKQYDRQDNRAKNPKALYGMTNYVYDGDTKKVELQGSSGFESIQRITEALGLGLQYVSETRNTTSYILASQKAIDALHARKGK